MSLNSFGSQATLRVSGQNIGIHRLDAVYAQHPDAVRLPFSIEWSSGNAPWQHAI